MATYETRARFGSLTLPAKPPEIDGFAGDENLRVFGNFLKAYINKYVGDLWSRVFLDETKPVEYVFPDDPYEGVSVHDLPALYVYRQVYQGQSIQLATDLEIVPSQFTVVWIPPVEINEERKIKAGMANAVAKAIYSAVQRGKDPVFQVEGFEHDEGTFIYQRKLMNVYTIRVSEGKWSKIDIYMQSTGDYQGEPVAQYPCLFININIEEMYERGITDDLPQDQYDANTSIEFTVNHGADITNVDTSILPFNPVQ